MFVVGYITTTLWQPTHKQPTQQEHTTHDKHMVGPLEYNKLKLAVSNINQAPQQQQLNHAMEEAI